MTSSAEPHNRPTTLPDILETDLAVIFCGINPGMRAATSGHHFAGGSNRFWRVIHLAGFTPARIPAEDDRTILKYGCGLTTAVGRPTVRADELSQREFLDASFNLEQKTRHFAPRYMAFLGKAAYSAITRQRKLDWGGQSATFGGARVWLLPNPSGLNRNFGVDDLVHAYHQLRCEYLATSGHEETRLIAPSLTHISGT